jgi:hypothetical protein
VWATCQKSHKRTEVDVPDYSASIRAAELLLEGFGKPVSPTAADKKPAHVLPQTWANICQKSDEELAAYIDGLRDRCGGVRETIAGRCERESFWTPRRPCSRTYAPNLDDDWTAGWAAWRANPIAPVRSRPRPRRDLSLSSARLSEAGASAEEPRGLRNGAGNPPTDQGVRQHLERGQLED